jgi:hypothetical protein
VRERRFSARVEVSFPARLRSIDDCGCTIKEDTILDNISDGGVYLRVIQKVKEGSHVVVVVRLSTATDPQLLALRLVAHGKVLRAEPQDDGTWGLAVEFRTRRVL